MGATPVAHGQSLNLAKGCLPGIGWGFCLEAMKVGSALALQLYPISLGSQGIRVSLPASRSAPKCHREHCQTAVSSLSRSGVFSVVRWLILFSALPTRISRTLKSEYSNAPRARIAWKAVLTLRVPLDARPKPRVICVSYSPLSP